MSADPVMQALVKESQAMKKLKEDVEKMAAQVAMFPELVAHLKTCERTLEAIGRMGGLNFNEMCPTLSQVITEAEQLL